MNPEFVRRPSGGHSNTNKVYHGHRETGLSVAAVCRYSHLMVVIVDNVTSKNENGSDDSDAIVKAAKGIYDQGPTQISSGFLTFITRPLFNCQLCYSTLRTINEELDKITARKAYGCKGYTAISIRARLMTA